MFTRIPRRGSHLRTAARQATARLRWFAAALAAVTCALLVSAIVPAASAAERSGTRQAGPRWHRFPRPPPQSSPAACPAGRSP